MRVLLTGATGQLGRALTASVRADVTLIAPGRDVLDLESAASIESAFAASNPDVVINSGAYTAVDKAESERELAFAVNGVAPGVLAKCCAIRGARLVHLSTDFVFDGDKSSPYRPDDSPNPLGVYGLSKLTGERAVAATPGLRWQVVRTAWVYAPQGRNFLLTMLRLFRERSVVSVVSDQIGTPTSALSLARCVWRVVEQQSPSKVFHYTDAGTASWYDFAVAIYEEACSLGLITTPVRIVPIATEQYPTPARRPPYSVLDKRTTMEAFALEPVHWRESLRATMKEMCA
jgi:dTDP-4-dehydrorhamnose reductase